MGFFRQIRCWLKGCPGTVVSGWRGNVLCVGFKCRDCGKVSYYAPAGSRYERKSPPSGVPSAIPKVKT